MAQGSNSTSNYRSIFKATSLFGGVQVFQILIGIIKSKIIAVLLGPSGVGILNLYVSGIELIKSITSLGLSQSAVRDVSEANGTGDSQRIGRTMTVVKKLTWITGLLGMMCLIGLSPVLSKSSFGDYNYITSFVFLSVILLFDQLNAGQRVILQGMRKLNFLAKTTVIGLTAGLIISIPFYYLYGKDGIVPTLIISSFVALLFSTYYSRKVNYPKIPIGFRQCFKEGKVMVNMGMALSLSSILLALSSYIFRSFLSVNAGTEMVGYYSVGVTITATYVGMIFSAMNADFYPRLVATIKDKGITNQIVSQQGEIGCLIMGPAIVACLIFMPLIIVLLYSQEFVITCNYVTFAIVGMMLRLIGWLSSIMFVAHGDAKLFAINETISNIYFLLFNIIGFKLGGLTGIGISFLISYLCYFVHIYILAWKKYGLTFQKTFIKIYLVQMAFVVTGVVIVMQLKDESRYLAGVLLLLVSGIYSFRELNKKTAILDFIKKHK